MYIMYNMYVVFACDAGDAYVAQFHVSDSSARKTFS